MLTFTKEQVREISEQLDCGFRAFCHKQKGGLIFVPDTDRHFDIDTSAWKDELSKLKKNFSDYQEIYAMETNDSFRVMNDFVDLLSDTKLQHKLIEALNRRRPFREFKFVIDNSGEYRQKWFDFKNKRYIEWVEEQLRSQNELDEQKNSWL